MKFPRVLVFAALAGWLVAQATKFEWMAAIERAVPSKGGHRGNEEDRVRLRTAPDGIQWESKEGPTFHVPFRELAAISYDVSSRNMALAVLDRVGDAANSHTCSFDCFAAVMVSPVLAPFKRQRHYVTVVWRANSEEKHTVFRMSKTDCLSFAQSVSLASGRPWRDLPAERRKDRSERQRR